MRRTLGSLAVTWCLTVALLASSDANDGSWNPLRHVTHRRTYTFVDLDSNCILGQIQAIGSNSLTVKRANSAPVTLDRSAILRITDSSKPFDVVYTAASSWLDVKNLPSNSRERVRVVTMSGQQREGRMVKATDTEITLMCQGRI